jgi:hypothetical protein
MLMFRTVFGFLAVATIISLSPGMTRAAEGERIKDGVAKYAIRNPIFKSSSITSG